PAKAYAKGTGHAVPDIPDPVARHTTFGTVKIKLSTRSDSSILVGPLFGSSGPAPVTVGNSQSAAASHAPTAAPVGKTQPIVQDTEGYFNDAIRQASAQGNIDKALRLLDEAERLGST
ncbi:MalM family protein, partial [Pantoea ananatis]